MVTARSGRAGLGEGVVGGEVDDRFAGAAVGGDEAAGQSGADAASGFARGAGGAPDGERYRRVAGDQVGRCRVDLGQQAGVGGGVGMRVVVLRRVLAHVVSAPRRAVVR